MRSLGFVLLTLIYIIFILRCSDTLPPLTPNAKAADRYLAVFGKMNLERNACYNRQKLCYSKNEKMTVSCHLSRFFMTLSTLFVPSGSWLVWFHLFAH